MYRIVRGIRTGIPIIQVFSLINEYFPEFRAFSFGVIIKDEQVIDPRMQGSGNIVSEFEGWIILSLLQKDDSLPSNADFSGEVILREALAGAVFFYSCLHGYTLQKMLCNIPSTEQIHLIEYGRYCKHQ